jgi:hypothetical protein
MAIKTVNNGQLSILKNQENNVTPPILLLLRGKI